MPQQIIHGLDAIKKTSNGRNFYKSNALGSDTFEKALNTVKTKTAQIFSQILDTDNIPVYKSAEDFERPILGIIGKSQIDKALAFNSSNEVQGQTLKCIEDVQKYIAEQVKANNVSKAVNNYASAYCKFNNGISVTVHEPYRVSDYAMKYDPLKTLTLQFDSSNEELYLKAYNNECDAAISKIFGMIEDMKL